MRITLAVAAIAAAIAPACAFAQDAETYQDKTPAANVKTEAPSDLKVGFGLTGATEYVWRGVSQSDEKPAVFATVSVGYRNFYAGAGTENVHFAGISQEYDLWGGYVFDLGAVKLDLGAVRYGYVDAPAKIDTLEGKAAISGSVGKLGLKAAGYYTGNYFGTRQHAFYGEVGASYPLTGKLTASGAVGRQQIDALPDYTTWNAGLSYAVMKGAKLDVRYHDTDASHIGRLAKARVVGSFSLAF
ncbi:TorF family putative porin [Novosphingobium sp. KCTC 2891]|uniref:TorF family putative porin n=1 Tax=Novosphingobium sp. KCTC 2891 TaxID=2989730 RepID=UPI002222D335|nr:TorF family putative porin [Novosphingobium sp. KCTC 2891]MCW1382357.1 TorF family putative porin [Novosphingobium sp. KCTC 2891]